jgi:hypothetical protein
MAEGLHGVGDFMEDSASPLGNNASAVIDGKKKSPAIASAQCDVSRVFGGSR